jgi:hypothetical protein
MVKTEQIVEPRAGWVENRGTTWPVAWSSRTVARSEGNSMQPSPARNASNIAMTGDCAEKFSNGGLQEPTFYHGTLSHACVRGS